MVAPSVSGGEGDEDENDGEARGIFLPDRGELVVSPSSNDAVIFRKMSVKGGGAEIAKAGGKERRRGGELAVISNPPTEAAVGKPLDELRRRLGCPLSQDRREG